ncbi:MAG: hypothetical protein ACI395_01590, partial [Candidatus Cryptobacteroides sp.]
MEIVAKIIRKFPFVLLLIPVLMLSGCDFFRRVAGRPDSEELAVIRTEVLRRQAAERDSIAAVKAREDSVRAERARVEDSLRTVEAVKSFVGNILSASSLGGISGSASNRYYIVLGSYKMGSNARALAAKASAAGYRTELVGMRNSLIIVAVDPSDKIADILKSLRRVRLENFCPE